jgi:6-phosphogluconolactonase/glucosamine-6-phosphate isomerase/deaminase
MRILPAKNDDDLSSQTEVLFRQMINNDQRILRGFFPTGRSAEGFYRRLRSQASFWSGRFDVLQIDEFCGQENFFLRALRTSVIDPLHLSVAAIQPFWSDEEMKNHVQKVLSRPIDFALLGLGPNGHVGFHEPGTNRGEFFGGKVELTEESFQRVSAAPGRWALTFGADSFLRAEKIILLITGDEKSEIYKRFLNEEPDPRLPASLLKNHTDLTVISTLQF